MSGCPTVGARARDPFETRWRWARAGLCTSTPAALADGEFVVSGPARTGRAAFVTREDHEDIADVITAVALDEGPRSEHDGATLEITGPEALTLDEAVRERIETRISWYWARGEVSAVTGVAPHSPAHQRPRSRTRPGGPRPGRRVVPAEDPFPGARSSPGPGQWRHGRYEVPECGLADRWGVNSRAAVLSLCCHGGGRAPDLAAPSESVRRLRPAVARQGRQSRTGSPGFRSGF